MMRTLGTMAVLAFFCTGSLADNGASTESATSRATALAKTAQNPLATLVAVPLQSNYNLNVGPDERTFYNLNVQPVIPYPGSRVNVIVRAILPINSVPQGELQSTFGLGDSSLSIFASPAENSAVVWGIGPILGLPTASNPEILGTGKWGLGPTAVIFAQPGSWTMGAVASNLWSIAGDSDREDYNLFSFQYFVNFNLGDGWAVGSEPVLTADWKAEPGEVWTIPWGLHVSKLTHIGRQPVNILLGYYVNSEHPTGAADRQVRFQFDLLFPTARD